jgi:hypothetical protein
MFFVFGIDFMPHDLQESPFMKTQLSRRNVLLAAGSAALSAGLVSAATSHAQTTSSTFTFLNGAELTVIDPWKLYDENLVAVVVPDSAALRGGNMGEVALGFYDAPQTIDDVATAFLTFAVGDASLAQLIAGGDEETTGANGVVESTSSYRLYNLSVDDTVLGFYIQLVNEVELSVFGAPVAEFAQEMASAQASIQIDGKGVFGDADAAEFQTLLEDWEPGAIGGEYTDSTGLLHVIWTTKWSEIEKNDEGIVLANQPDSIRLYISRYPKDGLTWAEMADVDVAFMYNDQGADATLIGPTVTDTGFSFVTNGEFGPRFVQGTPTEKPKTYVLAFAANFEADIDLADAAVLVQDAQANVKINGTPALLGLEEMV